MNILEYIQEINREFIKGNSTEHTFRGTLKTLLESLCNNIDATNEPKKTEGGNPDYQITKKGTQIPVAFIEVKDIDKDLNSKSYKEQFDRYKKAYDNLIITDYLNFQFFDKKKLVEEIKLGKVVDGKIKAVNTNFKSFEDYLKPFFDKPSITIKSSKKLAEMMAARARILQDIIEKAVKEDIENENHSSKLYGHFHNFKRLLIHDLDEKQFSDIFAQTLAYGLFAARLYDSTMEDFSRQEAAELIPKSNPFLRDFFIDIAGPNIDKRIKTIVDNLADVFLYSNVKELLKDFGNNTKTNDPILHFYETFLTEYDKGLRKDRGVWYTPEPVVKFIVRSVDEILKTEFGIIDGLADTSRTKIKVDVQHKKTKGEFKPHKVQILDPATGTGTFLTEVVKYIYDKKYKNQQAIWNSYVEKDLIPRLNGFELLMAPYSMAHVKLKNILNKTGYHSEKDPRFNVFLTNSLEEYGKETHDLFSSLLSQESAKANKIKKDTPVMCVIGNPPYSGESSNQGKWIMNLMEDYKKEPGGKEKLNERNPKMVNDDYVKFIKYGQHFIEKNGSGILAFINPHGFLKNPTFRGMRWNLLKTFDKIYSIDLHGNTRNNEISPDGSVDQNVFNIMQGVSINIFIKTGKKSNNSLANVFHFDLYGKRDVKYETLNTSHISNIDFECHKPNGPNYSFIKGDHKLEVIYNAGFSTNSLFPITTSGVKTSKDKVLIGYENEEIISQVSNEYDIIPDKDLINDISYRPFDNRKIYYDTSKVVRARYNVMKHFIKNIGLVLRRTADNTQTFSQIFITKEILDNNYLAAQTSVLPLYLYVDGNKESTFGKEGRKPNLDQEIVKQISNRLNLTFTNEKEETIKTFAPIDILDYIYAVLHSPNYRQKYKEFLKMDFPRVPYPKNQDTFWKLVKLGGQIRRIHLLESEKLDSHDISCNGVITVPEKDLLVERKMTKSSIGYEAENKTHGKVWINDVQYFGNVPLKAWEFFIGGYQPAQYWLNKRNGRQLSHDDVIHYQRIIVALTETDRLMQEIDKIKIE